MNHSGRAGAWRWTVALGLLVVAGIAWGGARMVPSAYRDDLSQPFLHRESAWAGSNPCRSCHPDHYASWHRTFHRTMTQEATPSSVVGRFDGRVVTFFGVAARPVRRGDEFFVEYLDPRGRTHRTLQVRRTVGSRRYQQYLVDDPGDGADNYYRIPLLWHIGEERWIHLNGAFLGPDSENYEQHMALWNQNCIFCHNTGPQPGSRNFDDLEARSRRGEQIDAAFAGRYESEVAELGISCESCHAPSAEHARRNRNPLRRYLLHLANEEDPTVVNPEKLEKDRSVAVCGQCHGQRLPHPVETVREMMIDGPAYRAGERLQDSVKPIFPGTPPPVALPDLFEARFWGDGTPRLTAYEYQGLLLSPCFQRGELTCISCHSMHGGDVEGQIEPEKRTNQACAACHQELVDEVSEHSRHKPDSSGSNCYECHMPRMVYGVLEIHRSHRIENPDPARDGESGRPNACTGCHVDRSLAWAAEASREWWGEDYRQPRWRADGAPVEMVDSTASLLAGDPVQRAVAARLASRPDTPIEDADRAFLVALLLEGLADNYPTIRWFSRLSLLSLAEELNLPGFAERLKRFDYLGTPAHRERAVAELSEVWLRLPKGGFSGAKPQALLDDSYRLLRPETDRLKRLQSSKAISIGE